MSGLGLGQIVTGLLASVRPGHAFNSEGINLPPGSLWILGKFMGSAKASFKDPFKGIYRGIGFRAYLEVQNPVA